MKKTLFLLYHDIDAPDNPTRITDTATRETVVRLEEFEKHMSFLFDEGFAVISVERYLDQLQGTAPGRFSKTIVLTFDDGHISNYQYALPVLLKYGFTATFYIIANRIGTFDSLGQKQIEILLENGMEIGSHGLTHSYLSELDDTEVLKEAIESKRIIQAHTKIPVNTFVYPGGHLNRKVVACVKAAGYRSAASCKIGWNTGNTDSYLYKGIEIRRGTSVKEFQQALGTPAILFFQCIDGIRSLLKKTIGLDNYEKIRHDFYSFYPFKR